MNSVGAFVASLGVFPRGTKERWRYKSCSSKCPERSRLAGEIAQVVNGLASIDALIRNDVDPGVLQRRDLNRVVGHDPHARDAKFLQHVGGEIEPALVVIEPQHRVGVICVVDPPGAGERGGETLHAEYDDLAFRILENHGAAGPDLGDGALDVDLAGRGRRRLMSFSWRHGCPSQTDDGWNQLILYNIYR